MRFMPSFRMMVASGFDRSSKDSRLLSRWLNRSGVMRPAPWVARATLVFGRAGRSR